jgi:SIR2-like protein
LDSFLELAAPLETNTLTLFIGTGFSKYLTNDSAPSWIELTIALIEEIDIAGVLSGKLLNTNADGSRSPKFELYVIAQILELEYRKRGKNIREEAADIIKRLVSSRTVNNRRLTKLKRFFQGYEQINIVTTNYDTLISDLVLEGIARVFVEGSTIPKTNSGRNVFHLHGCILKPDSMVLTIGDYYRFQHEDHYLSRKFFTLLQETTVLILGYSLADFNLNSILNEAQGARAVSLRRSDIYLASRQSIDPVIKDFYAYTYGVRVLDPFGIDEVFERLGTAATEAKGLVAQTQTVTEVLDGEKRWSETYLKLNGSLDLILLRASVLGIAADDPRFQDMLVDVLTRKKAFSHENNAWGQYEGLAEWLVDIGSLIDVSSSRFATKYLELVEYSFNMMSKEPNIGYSWAAFSVWKSRFQELRIETQRFLQSNIDPHEFPERSCVDDVLSAT